MLKPLVNIIINCHNSERYLHESLNTIVNQNYKNLSRIHFSYYVSEIKNWIKENKNLYSDKGYSLLG